jgi:predicted PurR-regulated permease PerM
VTAERQLRFWLVSLIVFLIGLYLLRDVLLPFVAGMAVAYLLDPLCDRLEGWGLSRTLATTIITIAFLILVVLIVLLLVPLFAGQVTRLVGLLPEAFEALRAFLAEALATIEARVDPELLAKLRDSLAGSASRMITWFTGAIRGLIGGGMALVNLLSLAVITPVVAFYLLRDWDLIVARIDSWLPRQHQAEIRTQARAVDETLAGFVRGQGTVCLVLGIFYAIGLSLAGLDYGLVVGLSAGILSFIPFVGSVVGLLLSVGLALLQFDEVLRIVIVAAIFFVGQALEGNFLTPKLVGDKVGLHPVWVIFALLAGGALFGFVGVLLALPTAAVIGVGVRFGMGRYMQSRYFNIGAGQAAAQSEEAAPEVAAAVAGEGAGATGGEEGTDGGSDKSP